MANIKTPKARVSYPNVFKARMNNMSGKEEYSVVFLFPKGADLSKLKAAANDVLVAEFGADKKKWPKNIRSPFRDQKERGVEDEETGKLVLPPGYEEGAIFINLKSKQRPGVVDQNVQDILDESQFYAGCWAHATVNAYYYDQKGNKGVSFGLINVQKLGEGDPLGNRTRPTDDFEPIAAEGAAGAGDDKSADDLWG